MSQTLVGEERCPPERGEDEGRGEAGIGLFWGMERL